MSNILKPWEFTLSDEVYVVKYSPVTNAADGEEETVEESIPNTEKGKQLEIGKELKIRAEAQQRILSQKEQEIIAQANLRAENIIYSANNRAKDERESIVAEAMVEADGIRDNAFALGYKEGYEKIENEFRPSLGKLSDFANRIKSDHEKSLKEIEDNISNLALETASKILKKHIESDDMEMLPLITDILEENKQSEWISLTLSQKMTELIDYIEKNLYEKHPQLQVIKSDTPAGTCIVDTPKGVIDASIQVQLENIKEIISKTKM